MISSPLCHPEINKLQQWKGPFGELLSSPSTRKPELVTDDLFRFRISRVSIRVSWSWWFQAVLADRGGVSSPHLHVLGCTVPPLLEGRWAN